jgi:hypothetical protein
MTVRYPIVAGALAVASCSYFYAFQPQPGVTAGTRTSKANPSFVIGERRTDLAKAAALARGAIWGAWMGSETRVIRVEFRGKEGQRLIVDVHVVPHRPVHLTCAVPCSAWGLKNDQEAVIERRSSSDTPIGEAAQLPTTAYKIVFLDSTARVVLSL